MLPTNSDLAVLGLVVAALSNILSVIVIFIRIVGKIESMDAKLNIMYSWFRRQIDAQNGG